jgi:parallel beta-helix repeat protein
MSLTKVSQSMIQGEIRSPLDFGAVGDGSTNDTAAFVLAAASGLPLDLRGLSYKLNTAATPINLTAPMFNGKIIVGTTASGNAVTLAGDGAFVSNVKFTGGAGVNAVALVVLSTATNFSVTDCVFDTFTNGGIQLQAGATKGAVRGNKLNDCAATSAGAQYGAIICNASETIISDNVFTGCTQTGISLFAVNDVTVSNNVILGTGAGNSGGIITDGLCTRITISGNSIAAVNVEGIQIAGDINTYGDATRTISITGNVIAGAAYSGITLYAADAGAVQKVSIAGNTIAKSDLTTNAIQTDKAKDVTITGNYIEGYAIGIDPINSSTNINVVGNTFVGQGTTAILAWASKSVVSSNSIRGIKTTTTGIAANSAAIAGNILICDNLIENCLTGLDATFTATNGLTIRNNIFTNNTTNQTYISALPNSSAGNNITDAVIYGSFTLSAGAATVANVNVKTGEKIALYFQDPGAGSASTVGACRVTRIDNGIQFLVQSTNGSDVSNYIYEFIR